MVWYNILIVVTVLVSVKYIVYLYFTRTFNYWKKRNVTGPEPIAFFGNIKDSTFQRKSVSAVFKEAYKQFPNEKYIGMYRMTTPTLLIKDLDIVKHILIKDFDVFVDRGFGFSKKGLSANLFHADGDTWRVLRNRFTPIFTSGKLKNMMYLLCERADKFVLNVNNLCVQQPEQEIHKLIKKYTVGSISACAFGLDIDLFQDTIKTLHEIDKVIFARTYMYELDLLFPGLLKKIGGFILPAVVTNFFNDLVKMIFTQRNGMPSKRGDFMDLILELRKEDEIRLTTRKDDERQLVLKITDDIVAAQAFVFYAAGYETSATLMTFMLYQLAMMPEIQDKLIAEIDEVLQKYDNKVTYEALSDMSYLDKVISETLRMYPPAELLQRSAGVKYKIPGTNLTIDKGQTVNISLLGIHYDEKYYPNPKIFDPERFSPENSRKRHPCAFLSFGFGPRNCIGMRFAQLQSRVCIVKMLSKFKVAPTKSTRRKLQYHPRRIVLAPLDDIYLKFVPRI